MNELIGVSLFDNKVLDIGSAPDRPMMLIEHHFGVFDMAQRVVQIRRPLGGISHLRTAQGVQVVQSMAHDFSAAKRFEVRQIENELRGRLAARHVVKNKTNAINEQFFFF